MQISEKQLEAQPRLQREYLARIAPELIKQFSYTSSMQTPKLLKIVLNMGMGEVVQNSKAMEHAEYALTQISGQKPIITRAKKSIATFKVRENMPIGCMVTLRGRRMYEFLERFINIALPRTKDFRGVSRKGFDGRGNYSMGIKEQSIFPEIDIDKLDKDRGMNLTFVTTANTDQECLNLLEQFGMPFKKISSSQTKAA